MRTVRLKRESLRRVEMNQAGRRRKIRPNMILGLCTSQKGLNFRLELLVRILLLYRKHTLRVKKALVEELVEL